MIIKNWHLQLVIYIALFTLFGSVIYQSINGLEVTFTSDFLTGCTLLAVTASMIIEILLNTK